MGGNNTWHPLISHGNPKLVTGTSKDRIVIWVRQKEFEERERERSRERERESQREKIPQREREREREKETVNFG